MIIKPNVTLFICEHCRKKYQSKKAAELHESFCTKNPNNFSACSGCMHLEERTKEIYRSGYHDGYSVENITNSKSFFCTKKEVGVYPLKVKRLGLPEKYPEDFDGEILMPTACELFNSDLPW